MKSAWRFKVVSRLRVSGLRFPQLYCFKSLEIEYSVGMRVQSLRFGCRKVLWGSGGSGFGVAVFWLLRINLVPCCVFRHARFCGHQTPKVIKHGLVNSEFMNPKS